MAYRTISPSVILRLPRYYRFLEDLKNSGITRVSSAELSRKMGFTASQIRQDLNCFGGFGQQGYGYNVQLLSAEIAKILGLDKPQKLIIIGIGNLGRAIATHIRFDNKGYELIGLFDQKESLVGQIVHNLPIRSMNSLDEFCKENKPTAAVLCIPKESEEAISYFGFNPSFYCYNVVICSTYTRNFVIKEHYYEALKKFNNSYNGYFSISILL